MKHDIFFTETERLSQIDAAKKLQAYELSGKQIFEASWACVIILFLTLLVGLFS